MARSRNIPTSIRGLQLPKHAWFGADDTTRGFTGPQGIETQLGRKMAVRNRHYSVISTNLDTVVLNTLHDHEAGAIPMVSFHGASWPGYATLLAGALDRRLASMADQMSKNGFPVIIRWLMEMNGDHNPYYGDHLSYVKLWVRSHDAVMSRFSKAVWVFCPQLGSTGGNDPAQWESYAPPSQYWDIMGADIYRHRLCDTLAPFVDFGVHRDKPFLLCETGYQQGQVVKSLDGTKWDKDGSLTGHSLILDALSEVKKHPNMIGYLIWNNVGPIGNDFIDTSSASLKQYRQLANDPYLM